MLGLLGLWPTEANTVVWPMTLTFNSPDHEIACPAERCVGGYLEELWRADSVGVGSPAWKLTRAKWEIQPTGTDPAYRMAITWPHQSYLPKGVPLVWTLRAYGDSIRTLSERSAPTSELVILLPPLGPTDPVVRRP